MSFSTFHRVSTTRAGILAVFAVALASCLELPSALAVTETPATRTRAETQGSFPETASAAEIYRAACANCHGSDGRGAPPTVLAFEEVAPDFSDCSFATREPDVDWFAVSHGGGPVRAFSAMMPSFGAALSDREIRMAVSHTRTFCPDAAWPPGHLNLPRALVTEKAYPEDEAVYTVVFDGEGEKAWHHEFVYEHRLGPRNQFELVVPFSQEERLTNGASDWDGGLGDVAVGMKRAVFHDDVSIVSLAGEFLLPTGDEEEGFGSGHVTFEPFLAYGRVLPSDFFLHLQAGAEIPLESGAGDEAFLRMTLGRSFTEGSYGRVWSPMVELVGSRDLVSGATTHWDAVPQVQVTLSRRQHVMLDVGVRTPVNDTAGRDTTVMVYLLWDWFDGGFFDGWR